MKSHQPKLLINKQQKCGTCTYHNEGVFLPKGKWMEGDITILHLKKANSETQITQVFSSTCILKYVY